MTDDEYLEALEAVVDVDQFLTFWAVEVLVGHWDGYTGNRNNFLIYRPPGGRFVFIPWGPDSSFSPIDNPFNDVEDPQSVMAASAIAHRLYRDDAMRRAYVARLKEVLDIAWDEQALLERVEAWSERVQEHALPEFAAWALGDTGRLRKFIRDRRATLLDELFGLGALALAAGGGPTSAGRSLGRSTWRSRPSGVRRTPRTRPAWARSTSPRIRWRGSPWASPAPA